MTNVKFEIPNSVGVKLTGRVAQVKPVIKKAAVEKECVEKTAGIGSIVSNAWNSKTMELAKNLAVAPMIVGTMLGTAGLVHGAGMSVVNKVRASKSLEEAKRINPKLNSIPQDTLAKYFDLVLSSSPTVATQPMLLANYLDYMIAHDGSLNFAAFKQLAELESTIANTNKTNRPLGDMAAKSIIDGTVRANFR